MFATSVMIFLLVARSRTTLTSPRSTPTIATPITKGTEMLDTLTDPIVLFVLACIGATTALMEYRIHRIEKSLRDIIDELRARDEDGKQTR